MSDGNFPTVPSSKYDWFEADRRDNAQLDMQISSHTGFNTITAHATYFTAT